jgi:hypothetical protein
VSNVVNSTYAAAPDPACPDYSPIFSSQIPKYCEKQRKLLISHLAWRKKHTDSNKVRSQSQRHSYSVHQGGGGIHKAYEAPLDGDIEFCFNVYISAGPFDRGKRPIVLQVSDPGGGRLCGASCSERGNWRRCAVCKAGKRGKTLRRTAGTRPMSVVSGAGVDCPVSPDSPVKSKSAQSSR